MTIVTNHRTLDQVAKQAGAVFDWSPALNADQREELALILPTAIRYMDDPQFHEPGAQAVLFNKHERIPRADVSWFGRMTSGFESSASRNSEATPLLTARQEQVLFLRLNYARMRAEQIRALIPQPKVRAREGKDLLCWYGRAMQLREQIAEHNLALVPAMAKRFSRNFVDLDELIAEGNMALLNAVDRYRVARGFKFSTYACHSIINGMNRMVRKQARQRATMFSGLEADLVGADGDDGSVAAGRAADGAAQLLHIFKSNASALTEIEEKVITQRFFETGSNDKPKTLVEVGRSVGLTKERVRQIQIRALAKMREIFETDYLNGRPETTR